MALGKVNVELKQWLKNGTFFSPESPIEAATDRRILQTKTRGHPEFFKKTKKDKAVARFDPNLKIRDDPSLIP